MTKTSFRLGSRGLFPLACGQGRHFQKRIVKEATLLLHAHAGSYIAVDTERGLTVQVVTAPFVTLALESGVWTKRTLGTCKSVGEVLLFKQP